MALSVYDVGDTVRLTANYTDTGDNPTNPSTVRIIYANPAGTETTALSGTTSLTNSTVGTFYTDVLIDSVGTWRWRTSSTGNIVTASEGEFVVRKQWVGA